MVDAWLGDDEDGKHFGDVSVRLHDSIAQHVQAAFSENWAGESGELFAGDDAFPEPEAAGDLIMHLAYAKPERSAPAVKILHHTAICLARTKIWIQNTYFIPEPDAIDGAAVKRGVDVRVLMPSTSGSDNPMVQHAGHRNFARNQMNSNAWKGIAWAAGALLGLALSGAAGAGKDGLATKGPLVIGHRGGGSGYLPDHTLEAYALGIELGADYVELDLVATKDGHLIVRHEPNLIDTTNVGVLPQFATRKRTVELDGAPVTGFFASDFTLAEIKQLRAVQPLPERGRFLDGKFQIPTLEESIRLVMRKSTEKGRRIGIYPETKHPTYHRSIGLPLEDRLLDALRRAGWNRRGAPVFIQSFEPASLRYLRTRTDLPLIQLVDADDVGPDGAVALNKPYDKPYDWVVSGRSGLFSDLLTPAGLAEVRTYADGIGPWKPYIRSSKCIEVAGNACADVNGDAKIDEADRVLLPATDLVERAHALGLLVHPFTFRSEQRRLVSDYAGNASNEYLMFYGLGVDGVFTDFADDAVAARVQFLLDTDPNYARCLVAERCAKRGKGR